MKRAIAVGDVVRLSSGGPEMTVARFLGAGAVCYWFDELTPSEGGGNRVWGALQTHTVDVSALQFVR